MADLYILWITSAIAEYKFSQGSGWLHLRQRKEKNETLVVPLADMGARLVERWRVRWEAFPRHATSGKIAEGWPEF